MQYDRIILGAGLYGLYAARLCGRRGERVLVLERDDEPFRRATYVNQARVHMGYHYPRSLSTAAKSAGYFRRFMEEFGFCVHTEFEQVYATSAEYSWTDAEQFRAFCRAADIRCDRVDPEKYFHKGLCDGAFLTTEYTYDAALLCDALLEQLAPLPGVTLRYGAQVERLTREGDALRVTLHGGEEHTTSYLLNATYASCNQVLSNLYAHTAEPPAHGLFPIKYELCEIILCSVSGPLQNVGLTVMDGPFFSIMPFGKTGYHSLTSVAFTPHETSYEPLPSFPCQERSGGLCSPHQLYNCDLCPARPESAWPYMSHLARKYMNDAYGFEYVRSLYSMKPILKASELDDSRPTVIREAYRSPTVVSVLSGKINTVYDLEEVL